MKVTVELLSELQNGRAQPGSADISGKTELSENATVADLITHLGIDKKLGQSPEKISKSGAWMVMINDRVETDFGRTLNEDDRIRILRWVAGG